MGFETDHQEKFQNLAVALAKENRDKIRIEANGGNSVLFVYSPKDELKYIKTAKELYPKAEFIDVREALVEFIDSIGWEDFEDYYMGYQTEPENIFRDSDEDKKLESLIIEKIKKAISDDKLPFLIHTGALFGTEIENIHIMENSDVMKFGIPLVVFYPADIQADGQLKYLGFKPASKYRCKLVK
jgi:hypothetical protein